MYYDIKKLIGRVFTGVLVDDENLVLESTTSDVSLAASGGDLVFRTDGDCCSETWMFRVAGASKIIGRPIVTAEEFDPEHADNFTRQEFERWYGLRFTTDAGACEVIYRNSSNGYYGGSLDEGGSVDKAALTRVADEWTNPNLPTRESDA